MAFDFSKLNIFRRLDARARIFVIFGSVIGLIFLVYLGTTMLGGGTQTTGPSRVAQTPAGLQTVPGGQQSAQFAQAVEQANIQRAQQAQVSGTSAVPTLVRVQGPQAGGAPCVICKEEQADVAKDLDSWESQGRITKKVADELKELAKQNVLPEEYADYLQQLVKEGKLKPEDARALLETYRNQHADKFLAAGEQEMDQMIKAGQLPLEVANQLLELQKQGVSTSEYAARLQQLVRDGKLSSGAAQALLAQYSQQLAKEIVAKSVASLKKMASKGEITPDVEQALTKLEQEMVPLNQYESTLKKYVEEGKMTPVAAQKILAEFKWQKSAIGPTGALQEMQQTADHNAEQELIDLEKEGKITKDTANFIREMIGRDVTMQDFKAGIGMLVQQQRLIPDIAKLKIADYEAIRTYRDLMKSLGNLQANNASPQQYAEELRRYVQAGLISPEQANSLLQEYQALVAPPKKTTATAASGSAAAQEYARLQQRLQQNTAQAQASVDFAGDYGTIQLQDNQEAVEAQLQRVDKIMATMSGQAQQLIASWQPPTMASKQGTQQMDKPGVEGDQANNQAGQGGAGGQNGDQAQSNQPALIKAGEIIFAVLDTEVNSDYPNTPVMATVVDGKYKGARLLGKLQTQKSVAGQLDRVTLNFTIMNTDNWPKSKSVTAFAIDPDTAKANLASRVNYHYLQRFGAIMATSFLQGYGNAISSSSATTTTGIFGTSTTNPELSPANKLAVALGEMGKQLGKVTENYSKIPPTVKVDSGVGLGILFMSDVT